MIVGIRTSNGTMSSWMVSGKLMKMLIQYLADVQKANTILSLIRKGIKNKTASFIVLLYKCMVQYTCRTLHSSIHWRSKRIWRSFKWCSKGLTSCWNHSSLRKEYNASVCLAFNLVHFSGQFFFAIHRCAFPLRQPEQVWQVQGKASNATIWKDQVAPSTIDNMALKYIKLFCKRTNTLCQELQDYHMTCNQIQNSQSIP